MKNKNIIIVGLQDWNTGIGSNCKDIALEFARQNRVLYVNYPLDRKTLFTQFSSDAVKSRLKSGKVNNGLYSISENIWGLYPNIIIESINQIKNDRIFDFLNLRNNRKIAECILKAAEALNFDEFILFNDNDIFRSFYLKDLLNPLLSVYYIRDFLPGVDYWKHHGSRLEPRLIANSDVIVTNSLYLKEYAGKYNSASHFVGQGCDFTFLNNDNKVVPQDLENTTGPLIGYVGALVSHRLDISLIEFLALKNPTNKFVLVGPEDDNFKKSHLHKLPNVLFTGPKPVSDLFRYISKFDVCINPQLVNPVTIGNYPRKIDEYLAMGKPVVATSTPAMEYFNGYVYLANSPDQFSENLRIALSENCNELASKRSDFATKHTWTASVSEIYSAIKNKEKSYAVSVA